MFAILAVTLAGVLPAVAQSIDDLNLQIHGYATQGFLYTNQDNIFTTNSSSGSPAWTEAVVNLTARPSGALRVGVQARYSLLGNLGNAITLDWAQADYKASEFFGVRFGKVKTPSGLFNDVQDIDPAYTWALLPQSVYPITSRNSMLSHLGGVVYGSFDLGEAGKLEYRGWGGERQYGSSDGYFINSNEEGSTFPNGFTMTTYGGALHWRTPLAGLMIGASDIRNNQSNNTIEINGLGQGTAITLPSNDPSVFAKYEKGKLMMAAEHMRLPTNISAVFPVFSEAERIDYQEWYAMATYKLTSKLTGGLYNSQFFNRQAALGPGRYSKDWTIAGRYDFNEFLYAKAEEHFVDGTAIGYDYTMNAVTPGSPSPAKYPNSRLTVLKIGVSF
jgi:hypothetical protein